MSLQQTDVAKKPRFDIEITTHCNAHCTFCPREDVPFLNHMPLATVDRVIDRIRALQSPVAVTLCGTGDCSTHPQLDEIVSRFASAFDDFSIVTNGARLHRERAAHLLDCGLKKIVFSVTEHGSRYNDIYGLPFQKTLQNITDFKELAGERCEIVISLMSKYFLDPDVKFQKAFWQDLGFRIFLVMKFTNRAGSLQQADYVPAGTEPGVLDDVHCMVPFWSTFIGADGGYYLCSHDFKKLRSFGHVDHGSITSAWQRKRKYFACDGGVCSDCSANPRNIVVENQRGKSLDALLDIYWHDRHQLMAIIDNEITHDAIIKSC